MLENVVSVANDGEFADAAKRLTLINTLNVIPLNCNICYVGFIFQYFMLAILGWNISYQESSIEKNSSIEKI